MTTTTDIANRALQAIGTRTSVTDAELAAGSTNEAQQINLVLAPLRDQLTRMAPWNHSTTAETLTYLASLPGTPENPGTWDGQWVPGLPLPPWVYMYAYPADCLRACWIVPQVLNNPAGQHRFPAPFKVGYNKYGTSPGRVVLTNQPQAVLTCSVQVTDPDLMDPLFHEAWVHAVAARIVPSLIDDKKKEQMLLSIANAAIESARAQDGNEGLTIDDHTPDWIRVRGCDFSLPHIAGGFGFDWGPLL